MWCSILMWYSLSQQYVADRCLYNTCIVGGVVSSVGLVRTSVFGQWTFFDLYPIYGWQVITLWLNCALWVSKLGQLSLPSIRSRRMSSNCIYYGWRGGYHKNADCGYVWLQATVCVMGGASGVAGGQLPPCALCPSCPPVFVRKNYMCPLDPSRPLSQRKFYVKIHEMWQNTVVSMLNFFLFPVVNGQSTCR